MIIMIANDKHGKNNDDDDEFDNTDNDDHDFNILDNILLTLYFPPLK